MTRHLVLEDVRNAVPLQRLGTSAEVAQAVEVSRACRGDAGFCFRVFGYKLELNGWACLLQFLEGCGYITGQTLIVDGGLSL